MTSDLGPQRVNPAELRPHRWWYAVAGVVALLGLCGGAAIAGVGFWSLRADMPKIRTEFAPGDPTTVNLAPRRASAVYVRAPDDRLGDPGAATGSPLKSRCTGSAVDGGSIDLTRAGYRFNTGATGVSWHVAYELDVSQRGRYEITCQPGDEADAPETVRYGVGRAPEFGAIFGKLFGSVGALLGGPCCGLLAAGVIALVVGLRRSSHHKRLTAERAGAPPPCPPAAGRPPTPPHGSSPDDPTPPGTPAP